VSIIFTPKTGIYLAFQTSNYGINQASKIEE